MRACDLWRRVSKTYVIFEFCIKSLVLFLQDLGRVEASIGNFAKQIETYKTEKERWLKRFKDGKAELVQLTKEITDKVSRLLIAMLVPLPLFIFKYFIAATENNARTIYEMQTN